MFKKITVAYNGSPEARRALTQAIHLARTLGAELEAITVLQDLPPYSAYAVAADGALLQTLIGDRQEQCAMLHVEARDKASQEGVNLETHVLDGEAVDAIVRFVFHNKTDLLVIGLHRHTSHISRLWSTVYDVALEAPCSILGVH